MSTTSLPRHTTSPQKMRVEYNITPPLWHKSAPRAVRCRYELGDASAGWKAWKKHLLNRNEPIDLEQLLPGHLQSICWGLPEGPLWQWLSDWGKRFATVATGGKTADPLLEADLLDWLAKPVDNDPILERSLEALLWCGMLPQLARILSPELWWALLGRLLAMVDAAENVAVDANPLLHQLLGGELALKLAFLLPEIAPCRELAASGKRKVSAGLLELLDDKGILHARHLALLRPLLASWTRSGILWAGLSDDCWTVAAQRQYKRLVRHALRLTRRDGSQMFSQASDRKNGSGRKKRIRDASCAAMPRTEREACLEERDYRFFAISSPSDSYRPLFAAALRLAESKVNRHIAALVLPEWSRKRGRKNVGRHRLPKPAVHSSPAATAVLRPQWSRRGEQMTVLYPGRTLQLELCRGREAILSGTWEFSVRRDGQPAVPQSDWQQACWFSDKDVDYLELEILLSGGLRVQRHLLLARRDHFLLLADAVLGTQPGVLDYRGMLPLGPSVALQPACKTREGFLVGRKRRGLVLPLALPEWRDDVRVGELMQRRTSLELSQSAAGQQCLFAPVFVDLDCRRMARPATWRQLTVAQHLYNQPSDVAVGYRVAIGGRQWLIYRSLAARANRTLLGHNLSTEMLVARFERTGEVESIIEVE
jgi:hypothetical protein